METRRPETIPGYIHPDSESYSKNNIYKTFTEGQPAKKKETFGKVSVGKQYASVNALAHTLTHNQNEICPICSETYISVCNCVYNDKTCKNGHVWYTSRGDDKPRIGNPHKK
jgi:hypothetical protein